MKNHPSHPIIFTTPNTTLENR
uniref:Uncharacterized protein n=1 Tax=Rhizophora mucronata TaxID=61149 RepID=A0A2P2MBS0_RHIMU